MESYKQTLNDHRNLHAVQNDGYEDDSQHITDSSIEVYNYVGPAKNTVPGGINNS